MRTIVEDDKVLFCGSDVAKALGYSNTRDALGKYCKNGTLKRVSQFATPFIRAEFKPCYTSQKVMYTV